MAAHAPARAGIAASHGRARQFRELLTAIVTRDIRVRYRETVLGFAWALFIPLAQLAVFVLVFSRVVRIDTDLPYALYAVVGLVPWTFFAAALQSAVTSLTGNVALVTKVALPRAVFPIAAVVVAAVDFAIAAVLVVVLMAAHGVVPSATALLVPVVLAIQLAFTVGMALLLSVAHLHYRDVRYLFGVLLTLWLFATSVVYPVERLGGTAGLLLRLNPMTPIINAYRALLLHGELPAPGPILWSAACAVLTLHVGAVVFRRAEKRFAEII